MTIPRLIGLLAILGGLGLTVLSLRADQVRRSHNIQKLQLRQIELQRTIWANQSEINRLRNPRLVRERTRRLDVPLTSPYETKKVLPSTESWLVDP